VELSHKINWLTKTRAALLAALFAVPASAWGQGSPCDLNHDGMVDSADVALAVNMALGTTSCTSNIEGSGGCTILTVQRVTRAAQGRECVVSNSFSASLTGLLSGPLSIANPNAAGRTTELSARLVSSNGNSQLAGSGLQFYPMTPCRLVDTRGLAAGFNGIAPFSGPSIAAGATVTIPIQSAAEASANTEPAPCGVIPSTAQAYAFNLTVVPKAGGAVDYVSMWAAGSTKPYVSTLDDPEGLIVNNAAIVPAGSPSGGITVFNFGPSSADIIIDMNGYFAPPATGLQFFPVTPCRLVDTRGAGAGFNGIAPFSGPSIPAAGTMTIPVQSAAEASADTMPAPCGVIPSTAQAYSLNLTVVPVGGAVNYVSMWPSGSARPFVATLDDPQGEIVDNAAIVPAGTSSGGVNVYNAGPSATDIVIDMNGYFAAPASLVYYPVALCRLVDTRGAVAGFNGIAPFSGPSIPAAGTLTIPVQSAAEAIANTTPAPCGVIPSTAQAYSLNLTVVPHGGAVDYVSMWPSGAARPFVATLDDPQAEIISSAAIVPAGNFSGGVSVYNAGPAATDVILDLNGYFAPPTVVGVAPVITSALTAAGSTGNAFSYQIIASNSPTSYSAAGLPAGLLVNAATGLISGTPTAVGVSTVTLGATNATGTGNALLVLTVTLGGPVITSAGSAGGTAGSAFSYQITATNSPTSFSAAGLPTGLLINTSTGLISGTPASAGVSTVTLGATNATGTGSALLTLTITLGAPVISSAGSAGGSTGSAFSYQITASNSPTSFSATGLPTGLSVNAATGLISGTPTVVGISTVTLGATNATGTGNKTLTLTVTLGAPVVTSAGSAGGTAGTAFSYQITASNSPTSFSATGLPTGLLINTSTGLISGTPASGGVSTVTLGATNATGTGNKTLTITIAHTVTLSWVGSSSPNIAGYNVYRGTTALGGPYPTKVNLVLVPTTTFVDSSVVAGTTYYYAATAVNTGGVESSDSTPVAATVP
jgi:hypothetical protein